MRIKSAWSLLSTDPAQYSCNLRYATIVGNRIARSICSSTSTHNMQQVAGEHNRPSLAIEREQNVQHIEDQEIEVPRCFICYIDGNNNLPLPSSASVHLPTTSIHSLMPTPCGTPGCGFTHAQCYLRWMLRRADLRQDPFTCSVCRRPAELPSGTFTHLVTAGAAKAEDVARLEGLQHLRQRHAGGSG